MNRIANRIALLGIGIVVATLAFAGCSSDDNGNGGGAGTGGSNSTGHGGSTGLAGSPAGGSTGQAGSAAGGSGGSIPFQALEPCGSEGDYTSSGTTVNFPSGGLNYAPKCLKVAKGATVTFTGTFSSHPLAKSTRGNAADNPIPDMTNTGTSLPVTFPKSGFYPYFCMFHGTDAGDYMAGVVWVN